MPPTSSFSSLFKLSSLLLGTTAILLTLLPVEYFILPSMRIKEEFKPIMFMGQMRSYHDDLPTNFFGAPLNVTIGPHGFMAVVSPGIDLPDTLSSTNSQLLQWYDENEGWFNKTISKYGGVLLRNFNIKTPLDFDNFVGHLHPDITTDIYLGTTPRFRVNGTRFIFTASEAPRFVTIPTHIELSFSPSPPPRIYFYANVVNPAPGGQTPLTDFRQVWRDLSPQLKDKMARKGLVYERWYRHEKSSAHDPLVHKTWQSMFLTSDKEIVKQMAAEQGYNASWDELDDLLLKHVAVITRINNITGEEFWCTHLNVLHAATVAVPYAWDAQILNSKKSALVALLFHVWVQGRKAIGYHYGANTLYADDESELLWEEAMHIREVISRNTWIFDYRQGDVVMLDNHRLAHGRTPWYDGDRSVLVAYH